MAEKEFLAIGVVFLLGAESEEGGVDLKKFEATLDECLAVAGFFKGAPQFI